MKRSKEAKAMLPNKIPISLIEACKSTAYSLNKSVNEWLQDILQDAVNNNA